MILMILGRFRGRFRWEIANIGQISGNLLEINRNHRDMGEMRLREHFYNVFSSFEENLFFRDDVFFL